MTDVRRLPARRPLARGAAIARSTAALDALLQRLPDSVERLAADGSVRARAAGTGWVGDRVRVAAGQAFPGDGIAAGGADRGRRGAAQRRVAPGRALAGDAVVGGSINLASAGVLRLDHGEGHALPADRRPGACARSSSARRRSRAADRLGAVLWAVLRSPQSRPSPSGA